MILSMNELNARRFLINVDELAMSLSFLWTSREFESLEPSGDEPNEVRLLCLGGVYEVTAETPTWRQHQPHHLVVAAGCFHFLAAGSPYPTTVYPPCGQNQLPHVQSLLNLTNGRHPAVSP